MPRPLVIFVTGFDRHALQAFEANALAYLLKPVETEQLAAVLERASKLCEFERLRKEEDRAGWPRWRARARRCGRS